MARGTCSFRGVPISAQTFPKFSVVNAFAGDILVDKAHPPMLTPKGEVQCVYIEFDTVRTTVNVVNVVKPDPSRRGRFLGERLFENFGCRSLKRASAQREHNSAGNWKPEQRHTDCKQYKRT